MPWDGTTDLLLPPFYNFKFRFSFFKNFLAVIFIDFRFSDICDCVNFDSSAEFSVIICKDG